MRLPTPRFPERRAALLLAATAAAAAILSAPATTHASVVWTLNSASAGVDEGGSYGASDFAITGTQVSNGIRLSGHLGPVDGSFSGLPGSYIGGLNNIFCQGSLSGAIPAGSTISGAFDFSFTFTGGVVTVYSMFLSANDGGSFVSGQGFAGAFTPGSGQSITGSFSSGAFSTAGTSGSWSLSLNFDWQGFAPTDMLTLTIPSHSIDLALVPAPGAGAALGLAGVVLARRRRR